MLITLWIVIQIVIGFNLIFPILLFTAYSLKSGKNSRSVANDTIDAGYGIIVTAYGQTLHLNEVIKSILKLNYENFLIYVVLDNCKVGDFVFNHDKVVLLYPEVVLAGNVKSHFFAITNFKRDHTHLAIIDSDNLVDQDFIIELNKFFNKGFEAVQGLRDAKNLNTIYACLDAARDIYYHYYDGKLLFETGSSATLSGSGMAFTVEIYKSCLEHKNVEGAGFDKVLQHEILKKNKRIAFAPLAIVQDEKTTASEQLVNQRARWINTWFKYFKYGFSLLGNGLFRLSWNQILFGIVLLRPPLFIFLLLSLFFMVLNFWIVPVYVIVWAGLFFLFILGFTIALINSNADKRIYKSLFGIPKFMFYQLKSLIYSRNANKRSVATIHTEVKSTDNNKEV